MSYLVLARKWRPRTFSELVGQEHIVRALTNALEQNRVHHALLFTGTRGVGKTTLARILAKSLNCERGVTATPCGECRACREVDEGRFLDLIEVDAASRRGIEEIRGLLDNVQYLPVQGRCKVYLVDEVHMLTTPSFNALLKTLEEPPPHVKFLFATTDPQKLPVTVLSRCLRFSLKRLSVPQIQARMAHILTTEQMGYEEGALPLIARAADGSLRDGLSLLDQAIAYGGGALKETDVRTMLGTIDQRFVQDCLEALATNDARALLDASRSATERGLPAEGLLEELLRALHEIALAQAVPGLELPENVAAHVARLTPETVQLYYQIGLHGRRDLPLAPDHGSGLEMTLLRMLAFRPADSLGADQLPARGQAHAPAPAPAPGPAGLARAARTPPAAAAFPRDQAGWRQLAATLPLSGLTRELVQHLAFMKSEGSALDLVLDATHASLLNRDREAALRAAVEKLLGVSVLLKLTTGKPDAETPAQVRSRDLNERQAQAVQAIESDPNVRALQDAFGASLDPASIRSRS